MPAGIRRHRRHNLFSPVGPDPGGQHQKGGHAKAHEYLDQDFHVGRLQFRKDGPGGLVEVR